MSGSMFSSEGISAEFQVKSAQNGKKKRDRRKRVPPVSIRFSEVERELLRKHAGNERLSTYVRQYVIKAHGGKVKRKKVASADYQDIARVLSALGRLELAGMLRDILLACKVGRLHLKPETDAALQQACADIAEMRRMLVKALGLRNEIEP